MYNYSIRNVYLKTFCLVSFKTEMDTATSHLIYLSTESLSSNTKERDKNVVTNKVLSKEYKEQTCNISMTGVLEKDISAKVI